MKNFSILNHIVIWIFLSMSAHTGYSESITVSGNVSGVWDVDSVYVLDNISIPNDETLTIEPGVYVEFHGHYSVQVQGQLLALGTEMDTIVFTVNDTTGFSSQHSENGSWSGIRFLNTPATNDSSKIANCKLQYGKAIGYSPPTAGSGGALFLKNFSKLHI